MLRNVLLAFLSVGLLGCELNRIQAEAEREGQMFLLKTCLEKGGFPEVDLGGRFKACKWPEPKPAMPGGK